MPSTLRLVPVRSRGFSVRRRQWPAPGRVCSEQLFLPKSRLVFVLVKSPQVTIESKEPGASLPVDADRHGTQHRPPRTDPRPPRSHPRSSRPPSPCSCQTGGQAHDEGDVLVSRQSSVLGNSNKLCKDVKVFGRAAIFVVDDRHFEYPPWRKVRWSHDSLVPPLAGGVTPQGRSAAENGARGPVAGHAPVAPLPSCHRPGGPTSARWPHARTSSLFPVACLAAPRLTVPGRPDGPEGTLATQDCGGYPGRFWGDVAGAVTTVWPFH